MRITAHPFRVPRVPRQGVAKKLTSIDTKIASPEVLKSINESTGVGKRSDKDIVEVRDQFHRDMTDRED